MPSDYVGQAFQPAGEWGFPAPRPTPGDWKVARTGRLESLPYVMMRTAVTQTVMQHGVKDLNPI